ncbi:FAD-dependent oxidoreductase [Ruegeria marina]|uniref:Glycine/D-amino acid oxidase n=1 Tax=Ruegeria marina TaxID=639004 RepID=A0A1G7FFZ5_9RHOB|nr:FAD-dependent oxidoreductase [Ruegeria marina]SDE74782.1 Glycine/D-amino acid oxidase [Ruegeria marina]
MTGQSTFDIIVIGAGIAGSGVAAELAEQAKVLMLEMESQPGYHTTGRSAAVYSQAYGSEPIRALTRASETFFKSPPEGFCDHPLLSERKAMLIANKDQMTWLEGVYSLLKDEGSVRILSAAEVREMNPLVREDYVAGGLIDTASADIDVHGLHHGYLRQFKDRNGTLVCKAEVTALTRENGIWQVATSAGDFCAPIVVNAAGAWADQLGQMAGAEPIRLKPLRRTALMVAAPEDMDVEDFAMAVDIDEQFYLKPDAGKLLISPANEDWDVPSDVQPDEMDVALCIHRIEQAFDLSVRRVENSWAGLRNFVADKSPVAGYSQVVDRFYWLAGQGGYGIQSAPALSRFAAADVLKRDIPQDILDAGFDPETVSPARLSRPKTQKGTPQVSVEKIGPDLALPDGTPLPFAAATRAEGFIFVSGQLGVTPEFKCIEGIEAQTKLCIAHIKRILNAAGAELTDVTKVTVWLTGYEEFAAFNEAFGEAFEGHLPARSTVISPLVLPDALVEIEAVARDPRN